RLSRATVPPLKTLVVFWSSNSFVMARYDLASVLMSIFIEMTGRQLGRPVFAQRWHRRPADSHDLGAAVAEHTARRQRRQRRCDARDTAEAAAVVQLGQAVDQQLCIGMERLAEDILNSPQLHQASGVH